VISFVRKGAKPDEIYLVVGHYTPVLKKNYRVGVPLAGFWRKSLTPPPMSIMRGPGQSGRGARPGSRKGLGRPAVLFGKWCCRRIRRWSSNTRLNSFLGLSRQFWQIAGSGYFAYLSRVLPDTLLRFAHIRLALHPDLPSLNPKARGLLA
jgi:hypothetical protein